MFTFNVVRDDDTVFMTITVKSDTVTGASRVIPDMPGMSLYLV